MADPLSAIGGAASVLQLAGVAIASVKTIHDAVTGYRDAPKQMLVLERDVNQLVSILTHIRIYHKTAPSNDPAIAAIFDGLRRPMDDCHRDLEALQKFMAKMRINSSDRREQVWKRLKVMVKEKEFTGVKDRIAQNLRTLSMQETLITQQLVKTGNDRISSKLHDVDRDVRRNTESIQVVQDTTNDVKSRVDKVGNTVRKVDEGVAKIQQSLSGTKAEEKEMLQLRVIKWLSKLDFRQAYKDLYRRVHPGTGRWFLELPEYRAFLERSSSNLLWCTAKPGFGKSSLASVVATTLEENLSKHPSSALLCLFIDKRDPRTLDSTSLLANLVKQICWELHTQSAPLPSPLIKFFKEGKNRGSKLSFTEAHRFFTDAASLFQNIYLLVDGLDECAEEDMSDVLQLLREFARSTKPVMKVLVMSRMNEDVRTGLKDHLHLKMTPGMNQNDINTFLRSVIGEQSERPRNPALRTQVVETLASRADGMFQYVKFQIKNISATIDDRSLWEAVKKFPSGLDGVYEDILSRVNSQGDAKRDLAWKVFMWTVSAVRPLTLAEISEALCVRPGMTAIYDDIRIDTNLVVAVCQGLVISDDESQVKADHTSIHEFLARRIIENTNPVVEYSIAETCLTYLLFDDFKTGPCSDGEALQMRLLYHPFIAYCALFWPDHCRGKPETQSRELLMGFVGCFPAVESCWQIYHFIRQNSRRFPRAGSVLHVFARCGFETIRDLPIDDEILTKQGKGGAGTPLHAAAWGGHLNAVDFLLARVHDVDGNVVIDVNATNDSSWTPLHLAIFNGHLGVMERLIAAGARLDLPHAETGNYPLHLASFGPNPEIVRVLLSNGAPVDVKNLEGIMPLYFAVTFNRAQTIRLLLSHGANTLSEEEPNDGLTLFYQAATTGSKELISLMLDAVPTASRRNLLSSALSAAVHGKDTLMMRFLIDAGADVNFIFRKWAPLHIAARRGHPKTLRMLLSSGAMVEIRTLSSAQATPLGIAAVSGKEDCIDILLGGGAKPTGLSQGATLLDCVVEHDDEEVALRIMDRYNLAELQRGDSQAALAIAAGKGHVKVVEALLDVGFSPDALSAYRGLQLDSATLNKQGIADSKGESETTRIKRGAMHAAAANGHLHVISLLYRAEANIDLLASNGYSPLHEAAFKGQATIVEWLLAKGANPCLRDADNCTAIELASFEGHLKVTELLRKVSETTTHEGCPCHNQDPAVPLPGEDFNPEIAETNLNFTRRDSSPWHRRRRSSLRISSRSRSRRNSVVQVPAVDGAATPLSPSRSVISFFEDGLASPGLGNSAIMGTPLHLAAYYGQDGIVQTLLKEGVDPHATVAEGVSQNALHLAVSRDKIVSAEDLLSHGVDPNAVDDMGYTPLGYAAEAGNVEMARLLIRHGADVNTVAVTNNNSRPLEIAIVKGHDDVLGVLVAAGAQLDKPCLGHTPLMLATSLGHENIVCQLIECGVDVNAMGVGEYVGLRAIHMAVLDKQEEVLRILLDSGSELDPESHGPTPLMIAACLDADDLVSFLAGRGSDVNALRDACAGPMSAIYDCDALRPHGGLTAAHFAISKGAVESLTVLLKHGANVNARCSSTCFTLIHFAVQFRDFQSLRVLFDAGANPKVVDDWRWTAFDVAIMKGYQDSASELLRLAPSFASTVINGLPVFALAAYLRQETLLGQILDTMDDTPWKLFCVAVLEDDQESVADMLVFFTDDLPMDDYLKWTPVMLAVLLERTELVMLIDTLWWKKPLPLAHLDRYGMTPLHWAAAAGLDDMVRMIVDMQYPDPAAKDKWGRTPEHLALYRSTQEALHRVEETTERKDEIRSWVPRDYIDDEHGRANLFAISCDFCRRLVEGGYHWCDDCKIDTCDSCLRHGHAAKVRCAVGKTGHRFHFLQNHLFIVSPAIPTISKIK